MHYFSGIIALVGTVTLLYGMTDVFPKDAYEQLVSDIGRRRKEKDAQSGKGGSQNR